MSQQFTIWWKQIYHNYWINVAGMLDRNRLRGSFVPQKRLPVREPLKIAVYRRIDDNNATGNAQGAFMIRSKLTQIMF